MNDVESLTPKDLMDFRLRHAWAWFELHAKQRQVMFRFFLLTVGVLLAALVTSHREGFRYIEIGIALIGVIACLSSFFFDRRNRQMASNAEDVLEKLEKEVLFPEDFTDEQGDRIGCLLKERQLNMREGENRSLWKWAHKHKVWIHTFQAVTVLFFLIVLIFGLPGRGEEPGSKMGNSGTIDIQTDLGRLLQELKELELRATAERSEIQNRLLGIESRLEKLSSDNINERNTP
jgi:hypothetical protein